MRYRRRPTTIEAEQYLGLDQHPLPRGVRVSYSGPKPVAYVITIHGQVTPVQPGDWIMPEPDGEHFYPCKPDVFEATYEPVE